MTDATRWLRSEMEDARERAEAATEGPWKLWNGWGSLDRDGLHRVERIGPKAGGGIERPHHHDVSPDTHPRDMTGPKEDFEFVAHARRDLPAALTVLDRIGTDLARADMDTLFDALDRLEDAAGPEVVEVLGELRDVALRREEA